MTEQKQKPSIGIRLVTSGDGYYFHVHAWPQLYSFIAEKWEYFSEWERNPDLHNVLASCQCDREKQGDNPSYAWSVENQAPRFDLRDAQRAVKQLGPIDKKMNKIAAEFGRPQTFGQFVLHFSRAVGATQLVRAPRSFETTEHSVDIINVAFHVDELIREFHAKFAAKSA
jgi:hypothetical protein